MSTSMPALALEARLCDSRLEGFLDCEELIASMLERLAADERRRAFQHSDTKHMDRAAALVEAALAVRLGQHRKEG